MIMNRTCLQRRFLHYPARVLTYCALAATALAEWSNPYTHTIVDRNSFRLVPEPPQAAAVAAPVVAPPLAVVKLTGVMNIGLRPRALLEITSAPGKQPVKPILEEGERAEGIEVLSIDVVHNVITIRNAEIVTNLTFEVAHAAVAAATPSPPASFNPGHIPNRPAAAPPGWPPNGANSTPPSYTPPNPAAVNPASRSGISLLGSGMPAGGPSPRGSAPTVMAPGVSLGSGPPLPPGAAK